MNRVELKTKAKKILNGKWPETIKIQLTFLGIQLLIGLFLGIVITIFKIDENIANLIENIVTLIVSGMFSFGLLNYYLKLSQGEYVTYKELFNRKDMLLSYISIQIVTTVFIILWSFLFIIPGIIAAISYSFTYIIKLENPEISTLDAIKKSKEMLKGHKIDYTIISLSFLGWIILSIFTFGFGFLWLIPYMSLTNVLFYNQLKENKN